MGKFDVEGLVRECTRELGKYSETQQEIIKEYMMFTKEFIDFVSEREKNIFKKMGFYRRDIDEKVAELQKKYGIKSEDVMAARTMRFNLGGIGCNINDFSIIYLMVIDLKKYGTYGEDLIEIKRFGGTVKEVLERFVQQDAEGYVVTGVR